MPSNSLTEVEIISPQLRQDIVKGQDMNLSSLLIPGFNPDGICATLLATLGSTNSGASTIGSRLPLTIQEFILAFMMYHSVMCEAHPFRRVELDQYLADIVEMSSQFEGGVAAFMSTTKLSLPERRLCCSATIRKLTGAS